MPITGEVRIICPACGAGTNSYGWPFQTYWAVTLHVAAKILGGDATHRIWVRKRAPTLDLAGWSNKPQHMGYMKPLAELIYPTIEQAVDEVLLTEDSSGARSTDMSRSRTMLERLVVDLGREMVRILDAVDDEQKQQGEPITARIARLSFSGRIPRHVAALMRAIREYRNIVEHEGKKLSEADALAIKGAWKVIHEWASAEQIEHQTVDEF